MFRIVRRSVLWRDFLEFINFITERKRLLYIRLQYCTLRVALTVIGLVFCKTRYDWTLSILRVWLGYTCMRRSMTLVVKWCRKTCVLAAASVHVCHASWYSSRWLHASRPGFHVWEPGVKPKELAQKLHGVYIVSCWHGSRVKHQNDN